MPPSYGKGICYSQYFFIISFSHSSHNEAPHPHLSFHPLAALDRLAAHRVRVSLLPESRDHLLRRLDVAPSLAECGIRILGALLATDHVHRRRARRRRGFCVLVSDCFRHRDVVRAVVRSGSPWDGAVFELDLIISAREGAIRGDR